MHVTAGELRDVSTKHRQVAGDIASAGEATAGAGAKIAASHGLACAPTAAAVLAAEWSRVSAAQSMQSVSGDLAAKLDSAASTYDDTDRREGSGLDDQMHPR